MQTGIWQHYKTALYLALGTAHDANSADLREAVDALAALILAPDAPDRPDQREALARVYDLLGSDEEGNRELVSYVPLQLDGAHAGPRMAARTRSDFDAAVCADENCSSYGQALGPFPDPCREHGRYRFRYLAENLTGDMLP